MPIQLAGQAVVVDHLDKLEQYLALRLPSPDWPFQREQDRNLAPVDGHLPRFPALPPCRITELQLPGGYFSRYGRSLQVLDDAHMPAVLQAAWGISWSGSGSLPTGQRDNNAVNLQYIQEGQQFFASLYLLTPIQLDALDDPRQLWLCPLVAAEYFTRNEPITLQCKSNTTWSDLLGDVAQIESFTAPASEYLQPDPGLFDVDGAPTATLLDLMAGSVGGRYAAGTAADSKVLQTPSEAAAALADAWGSVGQPILGGPLPYGPALGKLTLRLRKLIDHRYGVPDAHSKAETDPGTGPPANQPEAVIDSDFYLEHYHTEKTQTPTVAPVNDPPVTIEANANIELTEHEDSRTAADELAEQLLTDLAAWHDDPFDATWAGVVQNAMAFLDSAYTDFVSVRYYGNDNRPELVTRAKSLDPFVRPAVNFCQAADLYVHATEVAQLAIVGSEGLASFPDDSKSDTAYDGTPKNFALGDHDPENLRKSGEAVDCYWQMEQGWFPMAGGGTTSHRIRVQIEADLYGTNSPDVDWTTAESRSPDPDFKIPADEPPITNPLRVDCRDEGWIWLSSYTWKSNGDENEQWYVERAEHPKARHVECEVIRQTGGTGSKRYLTTIERYYRGVHPVPDETDTDWEIDLSIYSDTIQPVDSYSFNLDQGDKVRMIYDNNSNVYFYGGTTDYLARFVMGYTTWTPYSGQNLPVTITVTDHWEGYDPGVNVDGMMPGALGYSCSEPVTAQLIARWSPEEQQYVVISTDSAWLGPPKSKFIPTGVMTPVSESYSGKTCYLQNMDNVLVFDCDAQGPIPTQMFCIDGKQTMPDIDICWWVNYCTQDGGGCSPGGPCNPYPDPYPDPDDPDYPGPGRCETSCDDCRGDCFFEWFDDGQVDPYWVLAEEECEGTRDDCDCSQAPDWPGDYPYQIIQVPCGTKPQRDGSIDCSDKTCLWEVSGGAWVPVAGQECPQGCTCSEPEIDPATLAEGDQRTGSCDGGRETICTGQCVWRMASNYTWDLVGDNCGPAAADCGCTSPPDWGAPPGTEVRHDCDKSPTFTGNCTDTACIWYSNGTDWIKDKSCATGCPCPGPPSDDPTSVPIGSKQHVVCQENEDCTGRECVYEFLASLRWSPVTNNCTTVPGCSCFEPNWLGSVGETVTLTCGEVNDPPPVTCETAKCTVEYYPTGWRPIDGWVHCATGCQCPEMPTDTPTVGTRRALDCTWDCGCEDCWGGGNPQEAQISILDWSGTLANTEGCCSGCGGQLVRISAYNNSVPFVYGISQTGDSVPNGDCRWSVPVDITDESGPSTSPGTITITYDDTTDTWTSSGAGTVNGVNTDWQGTGQDCLTVNSVSCNAGVCVTDGANAGFNIEKSECVDPGTPGGPISYRVDGSRQQETINSCSWRVPITWTYQGVSLAGWATATYDRTEWSISGGGDPFGLGLSGDFTHTANCIPGFSCVQERLLPRSCSSFADQPPDLIDGSASLSTSLVFCNPAAAIAAGGELAAQRKAPQADGPGRIFREANPGLFAEAECPCNDTAAMLNRWDLDKARQRTRFLAENMRRAFTRRRRPDLLEEYTEQALIEMITAAIDQWEAEQQEIAK